MFIVVYGKICLVPFKKIFKTDYNFSVKIDGKEFYIFKGFETDLGSIPIPFRNIFNRFGLSTVAFIIHDFGYRKQPHGFSRKYWDDVLFQILKNYKFNVYKRNLIYYGVRTFGWISWKKNYKKLVS